MIYHCWIRKSIRNPYVIGSVIGCLFMSVWLNIPPLENKVYRVENLDSITRLGYDTLPMCLDINFTTLDPKTQEVTEHKVTTPYRVRRFYDGGKYISYKKGRIYDYDVEIHYAP